MTQLKVACFRQEKLTVVLYRTGLKKPETIHSFGSNREEKNCLQSIRFSNMHVFEQKGI